MRLEDITLDFVRSCYAKTGLTPATFKMDDVINLDNGKGCALQAIGLAVGIKEYFPYSAWQFVLDDANDRHEFYQGFDSGKTDSAAACLGNAIAIGLGLRPAPVVQPLKIDWTAIVRRAHEQVAAERREEVEV